MKKLTVLAMLSAIAYVAVALLRFPVVLFLSYEPKDVVIAIGGFLYGPLAALGISLVVSFIEMLTISSTGWIGFVMNFLSSAAFAGTAALLYRKKRTQGSAIAGLFGGALLIISLILLNNTIRVTIFSKRYLIHTMKLVGATRWFITKPFLGGSILQGIYAGLISWAMLAVMIAGLHEGLPEVKFVSDQLQLLFIFGAMMVGGILISLVFTAFAVRKFLRMRTDKLYLY